LPPRSAYLQPVESPRGSSSETTARVSTFIMEYCWATSAELILHYFLDYKSEVHENYDRDKETLTASFVITRLIQPKQLKAQIWQHIRTTIIIYLCSDGILGWLKTMGSTKATWKKTQMVMDYQRGLHYEDFCMVIRWGCWQTKASRTQILGSPYHGWEEG
jgi:hypothetical protein